MRMTPTLSSHVQNKSWSDDTTNGLLAQISKGQRLIIIIHTGGKKNGFVPNAFLVWKLSQVVSDYQHQMNQDNYER
jgi:hypothetical protein